MARMDLDYLDEQVQPFHARRYSLFNFKGGSGFHVSLSCFTVNVWSMQDCPSCNLPALPHCLSSVLCHLHLALGI